jgi:hypothetical protein
MRALQKLTSFFQFHRKYILLYTHPKENEFTMKDKKRYLLATKKKKFTKCSVFLDRSNGKFHK